MSRFELEHINTLWFMTLGVTVISAGVLVYVLLLESALGAFSIREFYPKTSDDADTPGIAVLNSDYTRNLKGVVPGGQDVWYDNLLSTWKSYLEISSYRPITTWITDETLEQTDLRERFDVLILPASLALSDTQTERIEDFMKQGGSVFASWKTGYYRSDGSERGWDFVESLFGIQVAGEVDRSEGPYRAYQAVYPGYAKPGYYRPVNTVLSGIEEPEFGPLSGYRWLAPLSGVPPRADYARADTMTIRMRNANGVERLMSAMSVSYFSWQGDDSGLLTPYPFAGFGMEQVSLQSNTPLTIGVPAGYGFYVQVYDPAVRFRIVGPRTRPVGYWTDWGRSFQVDSVEAYSSIVYGAAFEGRFVYSGFRRDAMGVGHTENDDITSMDHFFSNVMSYLRRMPTVWLRDWPAPYRGGAMISGVGQEHLENLVAIGKELEAVEVKSNFFVRPAQADLFRSVVERLPDYGEVGVLDDYSNDNFSPVDAQKERFANLKSVLEDLTARQVTTYRSAVPGRISENTHLALAEAAYLSVQVDSIERRATPRVLRETAPRLTQYGVTTWTDQELLTKYPDGRINIETIRREIERIRDDAGLYHFVYSTEGFGAPRFRQVVREIAATLINHRFWISTSSDITKWWRDLRGIRVDMEESGDSRLVLHITNQNGETVRQVGMMIDLGRSVEGVRIRPELIGSPTPRHELTNENTLLSIDVASLKPQQTRLLHIDLINGEGVSYLTRDIRRVNR